jgi:O-antigen/teichoic acid export membrane protein
MINKVKNVLSELKFYETIKHGSIYTLFYFLIQVVSVFSLPLFTKLLTPADFGVYEVFNNTVRILAVFLSLNLFNGFYRFYFDEKYDKKLLMQFLLRNSMLVFLFGSTILFFIKSPVFKLLNLPIELFYFLLIAIFSNIIFSYFNVYNNAQQLSTRAGIWQFVYQVSRVAGGLLFVLFISKDFYGRIAGENLVLLALTLIIFFVYFRKYIGFSEKLEDKNPIVRYSVNLIPIGLSGYVLGYLDTIMINSYKGNNDAGLYSYAYKIAVIYSGVTISFITANRPKLFQLLNEKKETEVIEQMRSMFKLIATLSCFFVFFSADAGRLLALNHAFYASMHLMPILILSYIINDINEVYSFYLHYEKKVKYFYISFAVAAVVNVVLNFIFIPKYGYEVAAYTTLISYGFMLLCTYIICKKLIDARVPAVIRFLDYLLIIVLVLISNYFLNLYVENWWLQVAIKSSIYICVLLYLWKNIIKRFITLK